MTQKDFVTKLCNDFIQRSTDQSASEIHPPEADLQAGKHMLPCSYLELVTTSFWHQAVSFWDILYRVLGAFDGQVPQATLYLWWNWWPGMVVSIQGTSEKCFCQLRAIPSHTGKQLVYTHSVDFSVTRNTPLFQHYYYFFFNKSFQGVSCSWGCHWRHCRHSDVSTVHWEVTLARLGTSTFQRNHSTASNCMSRKGRKGW